MARICDRADFVKRTQIYPYRRYPYLFEKFSCQELCFKHNSTTPITLVIEDTGIGIRAEDLPRIFEKGYTGVNGRESNRATGIGLYLCNKIMNCLGHRIYAVSEEGKGTKVFLEFSQENLTMY